MVLEVEGLTDPTQITATSADSLTVTVTVLPTCPNGTYNLAVKTIRCRDCTADGQTVILTENITLNVSGTLVETAPLNPVLDPLPEVFYTFNAGEPVSIELGTAIDP